jgi:hypothetical protein
MVEVDLFKNLRTTDLPKPKDDLIKWFQQIQDAGGKAQKALDDVQDEIHKVAAAGGLPALRKAIDDGVLSVKQLATTFGISETAITYFKQSTKEAEQASKAHTEQLAKQREALEKVGVVTKDSVNYELGELQKLITNATAAGVSHDTVLAALLPKYDDLARKARASGAGVDEATAALTRARDAAERGVQSLAVLTDPAAIDAAVAAVNKVVTLPTENAVLLDAALKTIGEESRYQTQKTEQAAEQAYKDLVAIIGETSPQAIAAYKRMTDAQIALSTDAGQRARLQIQQTQAELEGAAAQAVDAYKATVAAFGEQSPQAIAAYKAMTDAQIALSTDAGERERLQLHETRVQAEADYAAIAAAVGKNAPAAIDAYKKMVAAQLAESGKVPVQWGEILGDLRSDFQSLAQIASGEMAEVTRAIGTAVDASGQLYDAWKLLTSGDTKQQFAGIVQTAATAFQIAKLAGGGALGGAIGGATSGAEIGASFGGPVGGVVGAGIGGIVGFFAGSGPKTQPAQAFADTFGGYDKLYDKLQQLGGAGRDMWRDLSQGMATHDVDAQVAAIGRIQTAFANLDAAQSQVTDKITALQEAAKDFGGVVPPALQPVVDQLLRMTDLTDEQRQALQALVGDPSMDGMKAAADALGVSFEHMGQQFQQAQITDTAQGYARNLEVLKQGGADMNGVLEDSKDKLIALADQAIATGATLPDTLKDYYQRLIDLGELTGPDGELVTNIGQLTFAHVPDDKLDDIEGILESIRDILQQAIPAAVGTAQSALDSLHSPDVTLPSWATVPPEDAQPGEGYWGVGPDGQYGYHTVGGAAEGIYARHPTLAVFGEGGEPELGGPVEFMSKALAGAIGNVGLPSGGGDQPIEIHVQVQVGGQNVDEYVVKTTQKAARAGKIQIPANAVVKKF